MIEYRILLRITPEGATSEAAEALRTTSQLTFGVGSGGGAVRVANIGFSRGDGTEVLYETYTDSGGRHAVVENALGDCGEGECSREYRARAEVSGEGNAAVTGGIAIPVGTCGDRGRWLEREAELVDR